jgi:arrestin-related trafficking adapter 3/6
VDYFFAFSQTARRKDPDRRSELFSLVSKDEDTPLLPLPQIVAQETESTLHHLIKDDDDLSEFMASLMGPGPWTLQMAVTVPSADGMHFSNKNKRAPIEIAHTLKVVVRVQREDEQAIDQQTVKPKKYDIVMRTPVHILSVRSLIFFENFGGKDFLADTWLCSSAFIKCPVTLLLREPRSPIPTGNTIRLLRES